MTKNGCQCKCMVLSFSNYLSSVTEMHFAGDEKWWFLLDWPLWRVQWCTCAKYNIAPSQSSNVTFSKYHHLPSFHTFRTIFATLSKSAKQRWAKGHEVQEKLINHTRIIVDFTLAALKIVCKIFTQDLLKINRPVDLTGYIIWKCK